MKRKLLLLLIFAIPGVYSAFGQCPPDNISFSSQAEVDNFTSNYPGCKWLMNPTISGADITNLNGLSNVERVFGSFLIYGNTNLTSLDGLSSLELISGNIDIYSNPVLTDLDGLSGVVGISGYIKLDNNPVLTSIAGLQKVAGTTGLTITNNPQLSACNLPNFCTYLSNGANPRTISGNLTNCLNETAVTNACAVGCPAGDISFYSQADVDAFGTTYAHCTNITLGNVTVNGPDITNLDALGHVTNITGFLNMVNNPVLANIEGLKNLRIIGGILFFFDNPSLTHIDGLENVTNIGKVLIWNNAALTNLDGLSGLLIIGEDVMIAVNGSLTDISGLQNLNVNTITGPAGLAIVDNAKLAVCDLPNLCKYLSDTERPRTISGNLANCLDEAALTAACAVACPWGNFSFYTQDDLDEFGTKYAHCTNITLGDVTISGNSITDLTALSNVVKIEGELNIGENALLNLNGLENVASVGKGVYIWDNAALTGLDGLNNLTSIGGYLQINWNASLTTLNGLDNLADIGGNLYISNNNSLASLSGLGNITNAVGDVYIGNNPFLTDLGMSKLATIGADFSISSNNSLINLDGLERLTGIGGELTISGNAYLSDIRGIRNIQQIGGFQLNIVNNPNLSVCNLPYFCSYLAGDFLVYRRTISGNLGNCANQLAVLDACSAPCPDWDHTFYSQADIDEFGATYAHCTNINLSAMSIMGADIVSLKNLRNVTGIGWIIQIYDNPLLSSLAGLENITSIAGNLYIDTNPVLSNLDGLNALTSVGGQISILRNNLLNNISALDNINQGTITGLSIEDNPELSLCALTNFCTYLANDPGTHPRTISGNLGDCATEAALQPVCDAALPVTLISFTAVHQGRINLLEWRTATEVPGDLFEIEHSVDGRTFGKIGTMRVKGVTDSRYSFAHENPLKGINYYRLRLVNIDGSTSYGSIRVVNVTADEVVLRANPNPFTGDVQVSFGKVMGKATITVFDIYGKILQSETLQGNTHTLSLQHLSSGVYFIRYSDEVNTESIKVVK